MSNLQQKPKLPKDFADKWIESLTSGQYDQGEGVLRNGDDYCCLGVAVCMYDHLRKYVDSDDRYFISNLIEGVDDDTRKLIEETIPQPLSNLSIEGFLSMLNDGSYIYIDRTVFIQEMGVFVSQECFAFIMKYVIKKRSKGPSSNKSYWVKMSFEQIAKLIPLYFEIVEDEG